MLCRTGPCLGRLGEASQQRPARLDRSRASKGGTAQSLRKAAAPAAPMRLPGPFEHRLKSALYVDAQRWRLSLIFITIGANLIRQKIPWQRCALQGVHKLARFPPCKLWSIWRKSAQLASISNHNPPLQSHIVSELDHLCPTKAVDCPRNCLNGQPIIIGDMLTAHR